MLRMTKSKTITNHNSFAIWKFATAVKIMWGMILQKNIYESCKHGKIAVNQKLKVNNVIMWRKFKLIISVAECINKCLPCKIFGVIYLLYLRSRICVSPGHHIWSIWTRVCEPERSQRKAIRKNDVWKS